MGTIRNYTAKYTKIDSGYMGQLVEWPEVITEGRTIEECRDMLRDALQEMVLAYRQQNKEIPLIFISSVKGTGTRSTQMVSRQFLSKDTALWTG